MKSTGPKDTTKTRFNAKKHGLTSGYMNEEEEEAYNALLEGLTNSLPPANVLDEVLNENLAFLAVRMKRCRAAEDQYIRHELRERVIEPPPPPSVTAFEKGIFGVVDPAYLKELESKVENFVPGETVRYRRPEWEVIWEGRQRFERYESEYERRFMRQLNEIERMRRQRSGDDVPAPISINVAVAD